MRRLLPFQARLALLTTLLAFCVILLGAYVRLSDAGLGCPDWPGCYGQLTVPHSTADMAQAQQAFPDRPIEHHKAWKEMVHRYLASLLGLAIILLTALAGYNRRDPQQPLLLPGMLLGLVIFQGLLGMWTVTLLVKPAIVVAHLLGGFATLALLWLYVLRLQPRASPGAEVGTVGSRRALAFGLLLLLAQIALGGWTSSNYAALGCTEFPTCINDQWWPDSDFSEAFVLWRGTGVNYEFGVLSADARSAIHLTHRIGAAVTFVYLGLLGIRLWRRASSEYLARPARLLLVFVVLQVLLGISNVLGQLPLPVAVAHNGTAAILLVLLTTLIHRAGLAHACNKSPSLRKPLFSPIL